MKKNILIVIGTVVVLGIGAFLGANFMVKMQSTQPVETVVSEAQYESGTGFMLAVVDDQRIMVEGKVYADLKKQQEEQLAKIKKEADAEKAKLKAEDTRIGKLRATLTQEKFNAEVQKFAEMQKKSQEKITNKLKALEMAYVDAVNKVKSEAVDVILSEIASEQNLSFITSKAIALFYVPSLDVTETVIFRLNQKMPKAKLEM